MAFKLIREYIEPTQLELVVIPESNGNVKKYKIKGPFIQSEVKNKNGRIYSKSLMEREVSLYNKEKVSQNRAVGELDHSVSPSINLDRISHKVESLTIENNDAIGVASILETPTGKIAQALLDSGIQLGVSTRGVGTLKGNNVNNDYKLICIDIVHDPSAPGAFVEGILENKEYVIDGNNIVEVAIDNMKKTLDKKGSKAIKFALLDFLEEIKKEL